MEREVLHSHMILSGGVFFSKKLSYKLLHSVRLYILVYLNDGFVNIVVAALGFISVCDAMRL